MLDLVFATGNQNKVREVNQLLQNPAIRVVAMDAVGCYDDIPETQPTISGNALQKARYFYDHYHVNCFAEDTGLEVDALNGAPGVYSARYAGEQKNAGDNMRLLMQKLGDAPQRTARFRTTIALVLDGANYLFEGVCEGNIGIEAKGTGGFGYDPIFTPAGYSQTFAELNATEKNKISHRAIAFRKLEEFLKGVTKEALRL